jgi:hypothetical protein
MTADASSLWWRLLLALAAAATVTALLLFAFYRRGTREPTGDGYPAPGAGERSDQGRRRSDGVARALVEAATLAHVAGSYAAVGMLWCVGVARGAPAGQLAPAVVMAPVLLPVWVFVVAPIVIAFGHTGRVSAVVLPGLDNTLVAVVAGATYGAAFAPVYRRLRTRRLRRLRRQLGLCPACGYDLRGNVSGVCAECGTAASVGTRS